jgi:hypothetical protein
MGRRRHNKEKEKWYVLHAACQASQRQKTLAGRQQGSAAQLQQTIGDLHKHISHTITGPGRAFTNTEYFVGPIDVPNIPAVAPDSSLADTAYDAIDCAYIDYLNETDDVPRKRNRTAGVSSLDMLIKFFL